MLLLLLPAEIRQRIVSFAFPQKYDISVPIPLTIRSLLETCKQLHADTTQALKAWAPGLLVRAPSQLPRRFPQIVKKVHPQDFDHLTLLLFDYVRREPSSSTNSSRAEVVRRHRSLVEWVPSTTRTRSRSRPDDDFDPLGRASRWLNCLDKILRPPTNFKMIELDVTAVPSWIRFSKPDWLVPFVNDIDVSKFLAQESNAVLRIIEYLDNHCQGATIHLVGTISFADSHWINELILNGRALGIKISFEGSYPPCLDRPGVSFPQTIEEAIQEIISTELSKNSDGPASFENRRLWLKVKQISYGIKWDRETRFQFAARHIEDKTWTCEQLRELLLIVAEERRQGSFPPAIFCRRELLHFLAGAMNLSSCTKTEGAEQYVEVKRSKRLRQRYY